MGDAEKGGRLDDPGKLYSERSGELVVFGGAECGLCEEAMTLLRELAPSLGLTLRYVSIDGDPELEHAYRGEIPVGFLGGRKLFKYRVDVERLRRAAEHRGLGLEAPES